MYLDNGLKKNFTIIPNELICDDSLSGEARALFCYLASRPENWDFLVPEIQKHFKKPIQKPIKELEQARWLVRIRRPIKGKGMGFEWVWFISATKFTNEQIQEISQLSADSNYPPKITTIVETPTYTKTDLITKTENKLTKTELTPCSPPRDESPFETLSKDLCSPSNQQEKLTTNKNQINFSLGSANTSEQQASMVPLTNTESVDSKFEEMWSEYKPYVARDGKSVNKGAKKPAKEKFVRAVNKGADPDQIIEGTKNYIADCHARQSLTKNVVTFLNQEQWRDYLNIEPTKNSRNFL